MTISLNKKITEEIQIIRINRGIQLIQKNVTKKSNITIKQLLNLPVSSYLLDVNGNTQIINEEGIKICGFDSPKQAIGKSLISVSKKSNAIQLINNCKQVLNDHTLKFFDEINIRKDGIIQQFLSIKFPCYNQTMHSIGVFGISIVFGKHPLAESLTKIKQLGLLTTPTELMIPLSPHLTAREQDCLKGLLQGFTAKMIAKKINISHRTVEEYLVKIKEKFNVTTKSQLIEKIQQSI